MKRTAWILVLGIASVLGAGTAGAASVTVYWDPVTENSSGGPLLNLGGYRVFHATKTFAPGGVYISTFQATADSSISSLNVAAGTTQATLSLAAGYTHYIRVAAYDSGGVLSEFNKNAGGAEVQLSTTIAAPVTPPSAPTVLSTTTVTSTRVSLAWNYGASNQTGFRVERRTGAGAWGVVAGGTLGASARSFTDNSVSPSTTYSYRVFATNSGGDSTAATLTGVSTPAGGSGGGGTTPSAVLVTETAVYPNPCVGADPTIRAFVGDADTLEVTLFDASGAVVLSKQLTGGPDGTEGGRPYHEFTWAGKKTSGTYFAVIHGKKGGDVIRGRASFVVVR